MKKPNKSKKHIGALAIATAIFTLVVAYNNVKGHQEKQIKNIVEDYVDSMVSSGQLENINEEGVMVILGSTYLKEIDSELEARDPDLPNITNYNASSEGMSRANSVIANNPEVFGDGNFESIINNMNQKYDLNIINNDGEIDYEKLNEYLNDYIVSFYNSNQEVFENNVSVQRG